MVGLSTDAGLFFQFLLASYLMVLFFSFLEQVFIASLPNIIAAQALNGLAMSLLFGQQGHTDRPPQSTARAPILWFGAQFFIYFFLLILFCCNLVCSFRWSVHQGVRDSHRMAVVRTTAGSRHTARPHRLAPAPPHPDDHRYFLDRDSEFILDELSCDHVVIPLIDTECGQTTMTATTATNAVRRAQLTAVTSLFFVAYFLFVCLFSSFSLQGSTSTYFNDAHRGSRWRAQRAISMQLRAEVGELG